MQGPGWFLVGFLCLNLAGFLFVTSAERCRGHQGGGQVSEVRISVVGWSMEEPGSLTAHHGHVRRGNREAIRESINRNGFAGALVANRRDGKREILVGRHRWEEAAGLGVERVPVLWVDVDENEARRIILADNRTADLGNQDWSALEAVLTDLAGSGGLEGTGYDARTLHELERLTRGDDEEGGGGGGVSTTTEDEPDTVTLVQRVSPWAHRKLRDTMDRLEGKTEADRFRRLVEAVE
jgi:hypothetical protein